MIIQYSKDNGKTWHRHQTYSDGTEALSWLAYYRRISSSMLWRVADKKGNPVYE